MAERTEDTRNAARSTPVRARFEQFELDEANARLLRNGSPIALAPTPFAVLCALVRQPGALLATNALLDEVWGHQFVTDSVLRTAISELRTALGDDARKPRFIETVSRRGYRFVATTSAMVAAPTRTAAQSALPPSTSFIGRAEALSRLRANWQLACAGQRRIVWVAGEPGIGKTALIDHFVAGLGDVLCARGQCVDQYGSGEAYLPVLEAMSQVCRADSTLVPLLRSAAPTWLLQLPWLTSADERDALRRELTGVTQDRMLREMGEVLDRCGDRVPLLLVTEDLHWSDRPTLQLIDYVARRRGNAPLMWLATFRLAEIVALDHPLNHLRRELRLHGLCEEIVLDPFSETEVAEYVTRRISTSVVDEAFVRALHERTNGLPLFVASMMSEMSARAAPDGELSADAEQVTSIAVPENLAAIIDHYIARLDQEQRAVLSAAAVCGTQFRVDTIATMIDEDAAQVSQVCETLRREKLWLTAVHSNGEIAAAAQAGYAFRHALFREVLYDRTAPAVRARLHRSVGVVLERERAAGSPVAAAELAMHFERAGDPLAAVRYHAEVAQAALARFSPEQCMSVTSRALSLLEQAPRDFRRNELELAVQTLRGDAATRMLGAGDEAKAALQRAYVLLDDVPQHPMRGRLVHAFAFMLGLRAEYADALAIADRAEALAAGHDDPLLLSTACTVHGQVDQLQGRSPAARLWLERGLRLSEHLDVSSGEFVVDPQVALLGLLAVPLVHAGLVDDAHACLDHAYTRARARGWPMATLVALWHSALVEVRLSNVQRVAAIAEEMKSLAQEFMLAHGATAWQWFRGWAEARSGAPGKGHRRIRDAYEKNTALGMLAGGSEVRGYAAEALLLAGDSVGAERELEGALEFTRTYHERVYLPQLLLIEAGIARARERRADAADAARRAVAEAAAQQAPWLELLALTEVCAQGDATAGERGALAALVDGMPQARDTAIVIKARTLLGTRHSP